MKCAPKVGSGEEPEVDEEGEGDKLQGDYDEEEGSVRSEHRAERFDDARRSSHLRLRRVRLIASGDELIVLPVELGDDVMTDLLALRCYQLRSMKRDDAAHLRVIVQLPQQRSSFVPAAILLIRIDGGMGKTTAAAVSMLR